MAAGGTKEKVADDGTMYHKIPQESPIMKKMNEFHEVVDAMLASNAATDVSPVDAMNEYLSVVKNHNLLEDKVSNHLAEMDNI